MQRMEPRGIVRYTLILGKILLLGLKLQFLWLIYTFRGLIILGIFPAIASCVKLLERRFNATDGLLAQLTDNKLSWSVLNREFKEFYQQSFWEINAIGYLGGLISTTLIVDLAVNRTFIKSAALQYGLIVLLLMVMIYWLYVFTIYGRYQLSFWQYFRQSLIISIAKFTNTLAILVGTILVTVLLVTFPILTLTALVPLYLTPMIWFSLHSCLAVEAVISNDSHA